MEQLHAPHVVGFVLTRAADFSVKSAQVLGALFMRHFRTTIDRARSRVYSEKTTPQYAMILPSIRLCSISE